jgi:hypothetical protein
MTRTAWALLALLVMTPVKPAAAVEFAISAGGTFAVSGEPNEGGLSFDGAILWPFHEHVRFGFEVFANDLGTSTGRLVDPNDGTDLGPTDLAHRDVWGAGFRLDAPLGPYGGWTPFGTAGWHASEITDDQHGNVIAAERSSGFLLGGGVMRPVGARSSLGAVIRYHRLFNDVAGRYMSAAIEWRWTWTRGGA